MAFEYFDAAGSNLPRIFNWRIVNVFHSIRSLDSPSKCVEEWKQIRMSDTKIKEHLMEYLSSGYAEFSGVLPSFGRSSQYQYRLI